MKSLNRINEVHIILRKVCNFAYRVFGSKMDDDDDYDQDNDIYWKEYGWLYTRYLPTRSGFKAGTKKIVITIIKIAFAVTIITSLHVRCNFRLKNSVKIYILTLLLCLERFMCCQRVVRWLSAICPLENNFSLVDVDFVQTKLNK